MFQFSDIVMDFCLQALEISVNGLSLALLPWKAPNAEMQPPTVLHLIQAVNDLYKEVKYDEGEKKVLNPHHFFINEMLNKCC